MAGNTYFLLTPSGNSKYLKFILVGFDKVSANES